MPIERHQHAQHRQEVAVAQISEPGQQPQQRGIHGHAQGIGHSAIERDDAALAPDCHRQPQEQQQPHGQGRYVDRLAGSPGPADVGAHAPEGSGAGKQRQRDEQFQGVGRCPRRPRIGHESVTSVLSTGANACVPAA
ncbi:hypothetical protein G6F59_015545 [Rhizopus arrhizus]|nr:hypothetical protein G6F59_015545 [Rhizopus arrhizus]